MDVLHYQKNTNSMVIGLYKSRAKVARKEGK